jgi:hypothetical protein
MYPIGPSPIRPGWRSDAQRDLDNARLAAEEEARRLAERERAAAQPPPDEASGDAAEVPPQDGGTEGVPEEQRDQPQAGGGAGAGGAPSLPSSIPPVPLHHAAHGPPPPPGEEPEHPAAERNRLMAAWLDEHFDTVEAMALAGEAPVRPAPPPREAPRADQPPPPPPPVPRVRREDRWDKPKMTEFLRQLAATHSVSAAARTVGMSRESAHRLRNRLKGQPFDIAWEAAFRQGFDQLAHAALEMAIEGEEVPHYHGGELVGTHRKRSTQLILGLLRMRNRMGAPMLGRYGAAAEYWSENWDRMLQRIETGGVTWNDEREALGQDELARLQLPDASQEVDRIIERNLPDDPARRA